MCISRVGNGHILLMIEIRMCLRIQNDLLAVLTIRTNRLLLQKFKWGLLPYMKSEMGFRGRFTLPFVEQSQFKCTLFLALFY